MNKNIKKIKGIFKIFLNFRRNKIIKSKLLISKFNKIISHKSITNNFLKKSKNEILNFKRDIKTFKFNIFKEVNSENIIFYSYLLVGFLVSVGIFSFVSRPLIKTNRNISDEIKVSKIKKQNINKQIKKLNKTNEEIKKSESDYSFLIELIGGTNSIETFLATLNRLAIDNLVSIGSFEPIEIQDSIEFTKAQKQIQNQLNNQTNNNDLENSNKDSSFNKMDVLLLPELKKHIIEISLSSDFENLLYFLRDIELLENIVLIGDFKIVRLSDFSKEEKSKLEFKSQLSAFGKNISITPLKNNEL